MPNTKTQQTLMGSGASKIVVRHIHIVSDGSEETALVVYDNSTLVNDVSKGKLVRVVASGSDCVCRLEWDQTTDSPIVSFNPVSGVDMDFSCIGGRRNPGAAGATGDILLTTANLDSGDEVSIFLFIDQN